MAKIGEVYYAEDGTVSTVMDDTFDPSYEPSIEEIEEYAKWLGLDLTAERELFWLAREGLKAPLPKEWKPCKTDTGEVYYFNFESGDSIWDHPMDDIFKKRAEAERRKLALGNYKAPVPLVGALAPGGLAETNGVASTTKKIGIKKKASTAVASSKLVKGGAGFDEPVSAAAAVPSPAASAGLSALSSLAPVSALNRASGRLGAIGGGPSVSAPVPSISKLLPKKEDFAVKDFLNKGKPRDSASILKDAQRDTEKRVRDRLTPRFAERQNTAESKLEKALDDLRAELVLKLAKIKKETSTNLEDERATARRAAERRTKRELEQYEEELEARKEDVRRELREAKLALTDANIMVESGGKENEKEIRRKVADIAAKAESEVSTRRAEIHSSWAEEKQVAENKYQQDLSDARKEFEATRAEHDKRTKAAAAKREEDEEGRIQADLQRFRADLDLKKSEALAALRQRCSGDSTDVASIEDDRAKAVALTRNAEEKRLESTKKEFAEIIQRRTKEINDKLSTLRERADESRAAGTAYAQQSAIDEVTGFVRAKQRSLSDARENDLKLFDAETTALVAQARDSASGALSKTTTERTEILKGVLSAAEGEAESALATLRHKLLDALECARAESDLAVKVADKASRDLPNAATLSPLVNKELTSKRDEWLAAHPSPDLGPLPSLPPLMQESRNSAGLTEDQSRLIQEAHILARQEAEAHADAQLTNLMRELADSEKSFLLASRRKAEEDMEARLESYDRQLREEYDRQKTAAQVAGSSAQTKAASREQRTLSRIIRRQALRDELASSMRLEAMRQEVTVAQRVDAERRKLQQDLDALAEALMKEASQVAAQSAAAVSNAVPLLQSARPSLTSTPDRMHRPSSLAVSPVREPGSPEAQRRLSMLTTAQQSASNSAQHTPMRTFTQAAANVHFPSKVSGAAPCDVISGEENIAPQVSRPMCERIAQARDVIRKKKRELKSRQQELEAARVEWRMDMAAAKHNGDKASQNALLSVKREMERVAHVLNDETTELLEAIRWLKAEEASEGRRRATQQKIGYAETVPSANVSDENLHVHAKLENEMFASVGNSDLNQLLRALVSKADAMERRVEALQREVREKKIAPGHHPTHQTSPHRTKGTHFMDPYAHHDKSPRRHGENTRRSNGAPTRGSHHSEHGPARGAAPRTASSTRKNQRDPVVSKWSSWLRDHDAAAPGLAAGGNHVDAWLHEQHHDRR